MRTFTDGNGQQRQFKLNCYIVDLIRDLVVDSAGNPVDLLSIMDQDFSADDSTKLLYQLQTDRRLLCQVIHVAMNESAPAGVTFDEFRKAMNGDGLEQATAALVQEIISLFPPHKRDTLRRLVEMHLELNQKIQEVVSKTDEKVTTHLLEILDDPSLLDSSSGDLPENSESIPDSSVSAS